MSTASAPRTAVEVDYLARDEYPLAAEFLHRHWAANHVYARSRELFDWTFSRGDPWDRDTYSFAVARENGRMVGILGAIPFWLNAHGIVSRGLWLANWMSLPDQRCAGTGIKLLEAFQRPPFEHLVSFGINLEVARLYRAMRWRLIDDIPRHVLVLPEARDSMAGLLQRADAGRSAAACRALAETFVHGDEAGGTASHEKISWENELPADWNERGWARFAPEMIGAARDEAYLRWRYLQHPTFDYQLIVSRRNGRLGLLIWRLETIHRRSEDREDEGESEHADRQVVDRIGRVVEFLPAGEQDARQLLNVLVAQLRHAGALGADYYGLHRGIGEMLERAGFLRTERHPDGTSIPSRFQPLDGRGGVIMSAVSTRRGAAGPMPGDGDWYWTKSDADQDRPN